MLCWEPSRKFFASSRKNLFIHIREIFAKVGYFESLSLYTLQLVKGRLPPAARGSGRRMVPLGSSQAAKYHRLEAHACTCRWYCLTLLSEVSRNKLQMQQPSFPKRGFARAKHQGPWCLLFLSWAPCWWLGSADRGIFAKVSRKSGWKPKCILKGVAQ